MFRSLLIFTALFSIAFSTSAQVPCATDFTPEMWNKLMKYNSIKSSLKSSSSTDTVKIPIKVHIVGMDNGTGYYDINLLYTVMCQLNEQYKPVGFYFYLYGDVNYINSTEYYNHNWSSGSQMMFANNVPDVVNMYFVNDPSGACGYFTGWADAIAIKKSCANSGNTTIAHEIGHYFGLPHTFRGWEDGAPPAYQQEKVDGSNCGTAGDGFCDTPADYVSNRWPCPFNNANNALVDPTGTPISPDPTLYMSYAYDACTNRFSAEQINYMKYVLNNERTDLMNHNHPNVDSIGTTELIYPQHTETNVPSNMVLLRWKAAEGATKYRLKTFSNGSNLEVLVTDTFYIAQLDPHTQYYWRVFPFNDGNTCGQTTSVNRFTTGAEWVILPSTTIFAPSCYGNNNGSVEVSVSGGVGPYTYTWSNGVTGTSLATGISGGIHTVTITDAASNETILPVIVNEPTPVNLNLSINSNKITALPSGGTPPYSFNWSDGSTSNHVTIGSESQYTVTVVDANGCSTSKTHVVTSAIDAQPEEVTEMVLYPNPAGTGSELLIRFYMDEPVKGKILVYDTKGALVKSAEENFIAGNNVKALNLSGILSGIYIVKIETSSQAVVRKLTVY